MKYSTFGLFLEVLWGRDVYNGCIMDRTSFVKNPPRVPASDFCNLTANQPGGFRNFPFILFFCVLFFCLSCSLLLEVGRGEAFRPGSSTKLLLAFLELWPQAVQLTEACYVCILHFAGTFQVILVTLWIPSLPHCILEGMLEKQHQRMRW